MIKILMDNKIVVAAEKFQTSKIPRLIAKENCSVPRAIPANDSGSKPAFMTGYVTNVAAGLRVRTVRCSRRKRGVPGAHKSSP